MKRALAFTLTALFLLCAAGCGQTAAAPESGSSPAFQSIPEEEWTETIPQETILAELQALVAGVDIEDFISPEMNAKLKSMGVAAAVENIVLTGMRSLDFELTLSREGAKTVRLPISSECRYGVFDWKEDGYIGNFYIAWGGISVADKDTIAVSTVRDIALYSAATLEKRNLALDLSSFSGGEYCLLGAVQDERLGLVVLYTDGEQDGFLCFDGAGALTGKYNITYNSESLRFYSEDLNGSGRPGFFRYWEDMEVLHLDTTLIAYTRNESARYMSLSFYELETGYSYQSYNPLLYRSDGEHTVRLTKIWRDDTNLAPETKNNCLALRYTGGELSDWFYADGRDISEAFGNNDGENPYSEKPYEEVEYTCNGDMTQVSASCPYSCLTISLDFAEKAMALDYDFDGAQLYEILDTSNDMAYSLWSASPIGGGDYLASTIVLRENATGRAKFIANGGGMYGGYGDLGFYRNGDVYVQTLVSLKTFSPDMEKIAPVFRLEDSLPLGALPQAEIVRYLFAFRRDPEDYTYIIVYGEMPFENAYARTENEAGFYEDGYTYRVGLCDKSGRLLESWDTGRPVISDNFGFCAISLRYSEDELTIIAVGGKGHGGFRGVFDMDTHTYTELK